VSDRSAVTNATDSPFLRLPPELRCRIYDHLFGSVAIHIRSNEDGSIWSERHYRLSLCQIVQQHRETPRRYVEHHNGPDRETVPGCTVDQVQRKVVDPLDIGLSLLSVSRQIYHETVLKPFTQISFSNRSYLPQKTSAVQEFVYALVPAQAKAVSRLRIVLSIAYNIDLALIISALPSRAAMGRLRGLSDLEIVLAPHFDGDFQTKAETLLQGLYLAFVNAPGMQLLQESRLKSLRLTMEAEFENDRNDEDVGSDGDDSQETRTFTQNGERKQVEDWLRETEMMLHFGHTISIDEPAPTFAVVHNDTAIGCLSWTTPEGFEKVRLAEQCEEEESYFRWQISIARRQLLRNRGREDSDDSDDSEDDAL
jgi:hypothetical protein